MIISVILEALFIDMSLSLDAFVSGAAYGAGGVEIGTLPASVINLVCSAFLTASLVFGSVFSGFISAGAALWISFSVLCAIGVFKLLSHFKKGKSAGAPNKKMSSGEAAALAVGLSADGLAVGFSAGVAGGSVWPIIAISLFTDFIAVKLGNFLGKKLGRYADVGYLGGIVLIGIAVSKVL